MAARSIEPGALLGAWREKLRLWGLTAEQVDQILADGRADYQVPILAPIGGVVTRKNVVQGRYVAEGEALFEIADLDHVWIQAQVYEDQLALVRVGQAIEATVEAYRGRTFRGEVAFVDPVLDPATRTVNVRFDLENPGHDLRPGMFATVTLRTPLAEAPGFRDRIAVGRAIEDLTSLASLTVEQQQRCLANDAKLGSMGDPLPVEVEGKKPWVCCAGCEPRLKAEPARYLAKLEPPPADGVLSVPESAVIDTGDRKVVYVETGPGVSEGRAVVLGPRSGDRYAVLEGLLAGDRVAAAGAFLIDAESRLNPVLEDTGREADPWHPADAEPTAPAAAPHVH